MKTITLLYVLNASLLLLHEIESAYEKEWEILRLPGDITGFLLLHIPILLLLFYGVVEIEKASCIGMVWGIVTGIGGILPFLVHKIIVRKPEKFNRIISDVIIYANTLTGMGLVFVCSPFFG